MILGCSKDVYDYKWRVNSENSIEIAFYFGTVDRFETPS